jgi:hypothetical protein
MKFITSFAYRQVAFYGVKTPYKVGVFPEIPLNLEAALAQVSKAGRCCKLSDKIIQS